MELRLTSIQPFRITRLLVGVVLTLCCASLVVKSVQHVFQLPHMRALVSVFYVDLESSIGTWYSASALLLAAVLLSAIAFAKKTQHDPFRLHWAALACLFFGLSVDEVAMFHELPILPLRNALNAQGLLYYTWVVPGMLFVLCIGLIFLRFLNALPRRTGVTFVAAGGLFIGGAIGVEMLSGYVAYNHGEENLAYILIVNAEELMEMLGVVVFIHGLLDYVNSTFSECRITLRRPSVPADSTTAA